MRGDSIGSGTICGADKDYGTIQGNPPPFFESHGLTQSATLIWPFTVH
jgi:hypothetical protein